MKSEIKTALILGIAIAAGVGILSMVFSLFDEQQIQTTNVISNENILKIDN